MRSVGHDEEWGMPGDGEGPKSDDRRRTTSGTNTLVRTPETRDVDGTYPETISIAEPSRTDVIAVTYSRTPDEWLDAWRRSVGPRPENLAIVDVGGAVRSAAASTASSDLPPGPVAITTAEPTDLLGIFEQVRAYLDRWAGTNTPTVVCFHTITALLDHVDPERAFKWLYALTHTVREADACGYYRIDPAAHDPVVAETFVPLFDATQDPSDA